MRSRVINESSSFIGVDADCFGSAQWRRRCLLVFQFCHAALQVKVASVTRVVGLWFGGPVVSSGFSLRLGRSGIVSSIAGRSRLSMVSGSIFLWLNPVMTRGLGFRPFLLWTGSVPWRPRLVLEKLSFSESLELAWCCLNYLLGGRLCHLGLCSVCLQLLFR